MYILNNGWTQNVHYVIAGNSVVWKMKGFTNPALVSSLSFGVTTINYDASDYKIDESSTLFSTTYTGGFINVSSIIPENTVIGETGSYIFTWASEHATTSEYVIVITLPDTVDVNSKFGCTISGLEDYVTNYGCLSDGSVN